MNPFGVEDHNVSKRDYSRAEEKWTKREKHANRVENAGGATAGLTGATMGAAALRDAIFKDHPEFGRRMTQRATALPPKVGEALHAKPGLKALSVIAGGTVVGAAGSRSKRVAARKAKKFRAMNEVSKGVIRPDANEASMKKHKKVQGALGTTAAVTGLAALGAKSGAKLLPKLPASMLTRGGEKGTKYVRHLDRTADSLLFAGAGVGGASGVHQAQIMGAEGNMRRQKDTLKKSFEEPGSLMHSADIAKAFDSERGRAKRQKAYTAGLTVGAVGSGVRAAGVGRGDASEAAGHFRQAKRTGKVARMVRQQAKAERSYVPNVEPKARGMAGMRASETAGRAGNLGRAAAKQRKATLRALPRAVKVKPSGKAALVAVGLAGAAGANEKHRRSAGKPYDRRYYS